MLKLMINRKTGQLRKIPLVVIVVLIAFVFVISIFLNTKTSSELTEITERSIKNELISISLAAVEILDIEAFNSYNSLEDVEADQERYDRILANLRSLAKSVNAQYIYALKEVDGEYQFIFDTDTENEEIFIPYELSEVHLAATRGERAADVLNVQDEYGSFNTGAVPIYYNGNIVGILAVDLEDAFLTESQNSAFTNQMILGITLFIILTLLLVFLIYLLRKIGKMQTDLRKMAHNDTITGLPNRLYLFEYLDAHMLQNPNTPFALVFIDLDNFKSVNDQAGHDAGDELLRKIADFLREESTQAKTFHPSAGYLNVSARVGGDEFIQVYPGASTVEDAELIVKNLFDAFIPERVSRYVTKYNVSLSVGIALYPFHSENYHALIKYADAAMYQAKKAGKNQYRIYVDGMSSEEND